MLRPRIVTTLAILIALVGGAGLAAATQARTVFNAPGWNLVKAATITGADGTATAGTWTPVPGVAQSVTVPAGHTAVLRATAWQEGMHAGVPSLGTPYDRIAYDESLAGLKARWAWVGTDGVISATFDQLGALIVSSVTSVAGPVGPGTYILRLEVNWRAYTEGSLSNMPNYCDTYPQDCAPSRSYSDTTSVWHVMLERAQS